MQMDMGVQSVWSISILASTAFVLQTNAVQHDEITDDKGSQCTLFGFQKKQTDSPSKMPIPQSMPERNDNAPNVHFCLSYLKLQSILEQVDNATAESACATLLSAPHPRQSMDSHLFAAWGKTTESSAL